MEMESSRRPFSRSNEPGLKKARLTEDQGGGGAVNGRAAFAQQRQGNNPVLSRYRVSDRDAAEESNDPRGGGGGGGGGAYVPQPVQHQELVSQYRTALAELTFNSKPIITNLTIIAGESLNAAKAVTATICNNIIEVPSEQKLPSLYLLDSIVKNIGRDYIKYFAAKLPEVFCKAYRQVDAPIHQSMRHLFGTWKGVFPIQTLQMIEKELGFTSTANGASSGVSTSRSDTQSQRPAHSIHVNPKFMERQRLQQPIRTKGMASDLVNSLEDAERSDRVPSISAGRPWVDPHVKMPSMQRLNRDTLGECFHEKNVDGEYVEYDYDSDPRSSSLGVGRPGAKVTNDKPWYGGGSSVAESVSSQRNGFNIKRGLTPQLAPKSANTDPRLRTTQVIATRTSGALSTSWKNSEEEEFMWDDMNSRVTDHRNPDFSSNSGKERWVSDDPDNLDFVGVSRKLKGVNDYASTVDLEMADPVERKDLSALGQRMSSPWSFQESHVVDRLTPSSTPVASSVHLERYNSSLSGLSTSGDSSVARMGSRPQTASGVGDSSFGFPTNATSGSTGAAGKQKQQILGKSDLGLHNRLYEDSIPASVYNGRLGGTVKSQPQALKGLSPALAALQSRSHYPSRQQPDSAEPESLDQTRLPHISKASSFVTPSTVGSSLPDLSNLLAAENSGQSSTSSLLAAVLKTGILSNFGDKEKLPSHSGVQPPLPSGRPTTKIALPGSKVAPAPSSGHPSRDNSPAPSGIPQKVGHPPLPPGQPPSLSQEDDASPSLVKTASDPISNLLSSLVAKGLISASNSDAPSLSSSQKPTEVQKQSLFPTTTSSVTVSPISVSPIVPPVVPVSSQSDDMSVSESISLTSALPRSTKTEIKNLIGCEFKPDKLREFHPCVINELLDDLPHKCDICGLRLKVKERLERHLEWHALKNPRADGSLNVSRGWYPNSINWVTGHAGQPLEIDLNDLRDNGRTVVHNEPMISADESQCVCVICGNTFEDFYCQESDDWMFKGAIYMTIPCGDGESGVTGASVVKGPIVHASCIDENSLDDLGLAPSRIKLEKDV